jgi:SET domain-containing protein 6
MPGWLVCILVLSDVVPPKSLTYLQALTAVMLSEGLNKNSKWTPYLAVLPQQLDSLIFWSESELLQLQASTVVQKIGKASAEEMFSRHITPLGLDNSSTETCHRVASIIMAYAFDIPQKLSKDETEDAEDGDDLVSDNGEEELTILSMIPLADMLNADADKNNARLVCDSEDLEMRVSLYSSTERNFEIQACTYHFNADIP